jgi:hypothetical protein
MIKSVSYLSKDGREEKETAMNCSFYQRTGLVLLPVVALLAIGCPKQEETKNRAPAVNKVALLPSTARPGDTLRANQWYVNGDLVEGVEGLDFDTGDYYAEDVIHVMARAVELQTGRAGDWKKSKNVALGEEPGLELAGISIPNTIVSYESVEAEVDYGDLDPMDVDEIYYRWLINGRILDEEEASESEIDSEYFNVGDHIQAMACIDGKFERPGLWESEIRTVINTTPEFVSEPEAEVDADYIVIYLGVEDADGEPVEYFIKGNLPGSRINQAEHRIIIDLKKIKPGAYKFIIGAKDRHGGSTGYPYSITIPE